jgi:serine/threonine protein kinase
MVADFFFFRLETIHKANYIHRDFHSGNILFDFTSPGYEPKYDEKHQWKIGDLGLSQHANNTSSNNEIYGVIPYIAPEIFNGSSFSKKTDVYSPMKKECPEIVSENVRVSLNMSGKCSSFDLKIGKTCCPAFFLMI